MGEKRVRLGMIGTGSMGQGHLRGLKEIPQANVVAVCDLDEELAQKAAEPLGSKVYTEAAKMLAEETLDGLYICVPPHQHGDLELLVAQKGLALYVEKPVNLYIDGGMRAWEAIRKAGVLSQVGYQLRYLANARQMKAFLADKPVGTAHATRWSGAPGKDWWRRYDQGGGQLVEMTTHQVDLLRWVMGEVTAVSASYSFNRLFKDEAGLTVPDSQAVLLHFASGASATVTTACALGNVWRGGTEFVLRNARASLENDGIKVEPEGVYEIPAPPTDVITADQAFVRAIATGDASLLLSPFNDGLKSAAVTLAANLSAENGGRQVQMKELLGDMA